MMIIRTVITGMNTLSLRWAEGRMKDFIRTRRYLQVSTGAASVVYCSSTRKFRLLLHLVASTASIKDFVSNAYIRRFPVP